MQNASAGANKQIRILVIQVIDPRVLHDEHESVSCGQKKFPTIDNHTPRYFQRSWAETVACIRIVQNASDHEDKSTPSSKKSPTKKSIFVFSTTNTVLLRIHHDFRDCILLVYRRYGRILPFSYLSFQTTKLLHFSKKRTC